MIDLRAHFGLPPIVNVPARQAMSVMAPITFAAAREQELELPFSAEELRENYAATCRDSFADFAREQWENCSLKAVPLEWGPHLEAICVHIQGQLEDAVRRRSDPLAAVRAQNLLINCPPRSLKPCFVRGMVITQARGLIELSDVKVDDMILTHRGRFRRVEAVHEQGVLPLWELRTRRGRLIKVAGDHPVLTQRGWVEAQHVTTRDVLAEVHATETSGSRTCSLEEARLLGYLIGDGHVKYGGTSFTNQDPDTTLDFIACAESIGFTTRNKPRAPSYKGPQINVISVAPKPFGACMCGAGLERGLSRCGTCQYERNREGARLKREAVGGGRRQRSGWRSQVRDWRVKHNIDGVCSYDKRVPRAIMEGDPEVVVNYLAAYWACDGGIQKRVDTRNRQHPGCAVRVDATTVSEGLARDHQDLLQRLGLSFTLRRKETRLKTQRQGDTYVSWYLTAADQDTVAKFLQTVGPHIRHEKRLRVQGLQRTTFDQVLNPDEVVSVQQVGEGECRCLTVDEDSSFVYQGVAVHNTILLTLANAWAWIRWPWIQILYLSANPRVVLDSGRLFRDVIESPWYQDNFVRGAWVIRDDQDALSSIGNTAGGARRALGLSANVIGANSDWVCIDDAHAMDDGEKQIKDVIENYDGNVSSRLNDARWGIRTAIMQRHRRRDFSDHVVGMHQWFHLRMPMEFERRPECRCPQCEQGARGEPNAFGWVDWRTAEGEVLLPDRYTPEYLADRRRVLRHNYAGQMQQRPSERGGEIFKVSYWHYCQIDGDGSPRARPDGAYGGPAYVLKRHPDGRLDVDWVCLSVDPTGGGESDDGSALGMLVVAGKGERRLVLADLTPGAATWNQTKKHLKAALVRTSDLTGWNSRILVLVEKKALGPSAIDEIREWIGDGLKNSAGRAIHAKVKPYEPSGKGDKEARADFLEPMADDGLLYFLDGAEWLVRAAPGNDQTVVEEFAGFGPRRTGRDDRVDCLSQACDEYRSNKVGWVELFKTQPQVVAPPPRDIQTGKPPTECSHKWVESRCIICKKPAG